MDLVVTVCTMIICSTLTENTVTEFHMERDITRDSIRASDSVARTGIIVRPYPVILLSGVVSIHVYQIILVYTEIHLYLGMLHSPRTLEPVDRLVKNDGDSTTGPNPK